MKTNYLAAGVVAAAIFGGTGHAGVIACGSVSDASGDSLGGVADMASGSICIESAAGARLSVTYAPGTLLSDVHAQFSLDVDQNPATGYPGIDGANNDSALIGTEFLVSIYGSGFQGFAEVIRIVGAGFQSVGTVAVAYSGVTAAAELPLSMLDGDDGSMNFKVISQQQLSSDVFTGIVDYMTDLGSAPGSVNATPAPEPATPVLLGIGLLGLALRWRRSCANAYPLPPTSSCYLGAV